MGAIFCRQERVTHLGLSGSVDLGSSGAGIFGSSGLADASGAEDSDLICGCSGLTLNREVPPACGLPSAGAPTSVAPPSVAESPSPAVSFPRLRALSRLHSAHEGVLISVGRASRCSSASAGQEVAAMTGRALDNTDVAVRCSAGAHAFARMDLRRSLAAARRCEGDMFTCARARCSGPHLSTA